MKNFPAVPLLAAWLLAASPGHGQTLEDAPVPAKKSDAPGENVAAPKIKNPSPGTKKPEEKQDPASAETKAFAEGVNALSEAELDQIILTLQENYLAPEAISPLELKRATVQGLFARLKGGAALFTAPTASATEDSPFHAEVLDQKIGYARLGTPTREKLPELDAALQKWTSDGIGAVILDLRATPRTADYEVTSAVCQRFCPKGKVLFSVKKPNIKQEQILTSKEDPRFHGVLAVLVDANTAGNAEVIAAVLRMHARALIIGQKTRGEAAEYAEFPLSAGKNLRVAVAEVALPENVSVFPGGVRPDLSVEVPQETTDLLLEQEAKRGVPEFVFETERPRMNEAALVAGTNPEIDAAEAAMKQKGEKPKPPLRDVALQRAVDFITAVTLYEKKASK